MAWPCPGPLLTALPRYDTMPAREVTNLCPLIWVLMAALIGTMIESLLALIIHEPCCEVTEMPVAARKTNEPTGGVFEAYVEDRRARMTPPALADMPPQ